MISKRKKARWTGYSKDICEKEGRGRSLKEEEVLFIKGIAQKAMRERRRKRRGRREDGLGTWRIHGRRREGEGG